VQIQSSGNYPHQPHQGILEIIPRKRSVRKGRNGGWGGEPGGSKHKMGIFWENTITIKISLTWLL